MLGGLLLLVLLVVGLAVLGASSDDEDPLPTTTSSLSGGLTTRSTTATTERSTATTGGPTTSVAGTGGPTSISASDMTKFLRDEQVKATPDLTVGLITCPPGPYRVGHVVVCRMRLEDATVLYEVSVTSATFINAKATRPIIDTDKAETLVETNEPGSTADCGSPRVRQVDIGDTFSCRTAASTWDFTVKDEAGQIAGTRR